MATRRLKKPVVAYGILVEHTRITTGRKVQTLYHYPDGNVFMDPNKAETENKIRHLTTHVGGAKYSLVEIHGVPDASNP